MLNILVKDFKLLLFGDKTSIGKKILSLIFTVLMLAIFIAIETFLFTMIIKKVKIYKDAAPVYLTLFLFIISCIMIVLNIFTANKLFFNEKDIEQLTRYPITSEQIILSKLVFMVGTHFVTCLMFTYPLFLSYGQLLGRSPVYYFVVLFYPLLSFLFEGGVALLLVYPFKLVVDFLKKHVLVQFIVAILFMLTASLIYSKVLTLFMNIVINNNLNMLFTADSIMKLTNTVRNFIPINMLVDVFLGGKNSFFSYLCLSLGIFIFGLSISIFAFSYFRSIKINSESKEINGDIKVLSIEKILIKKELVLLFKDSNNIFSFAGLLIIQPFLLYLVVKAINDVFSSGTFAYYLVALPYFLPILDIVLMMLFTVIINSGSNTYISSEKKTVRIMKTIPVTPFKQIIIKVGVPYICSCISLIVSALVLLIADVVSFNTFAFGTLITIILLLVFEFASLKEELEIKFNKNKSSFLSTLYSYLLPFVFLVISLVLTYFGLNIIFAYIISLVVILFLALPFVINIKSKIENRFLDLEVVN